MILHCYRCPDGHVTEQMVNWYDDVRPCKVCEKPANMVFLSRRENAQRFDPVVIFRGPNGKVRFPGRANSPTPKGFQRVELKTSHDVHKFEREMNAKEISRYHDRQEREERCIEPFRTALRSQLRGYAKQFSAYGRDFAEVSMRENDNLRRIRYDPGFHVEAFHYDAGNREAWTDKDIGARGRK